MTKKPCVLVGSSGTVFSWQRLGTCPRRANGFQFASMTSLNEGLVSQFKQVISELGISAQKGGRHE